MGIKCLTADMPIRSLLLALYHGFLLYFLLKGSVRTGKAAQQMMALTAQPDSLSSIPGLHVVDRENQLHGTHWESVIGAAALLIFVCTMFPGGGYHRLFKQGPISGACLLLIFGRV